MLAQNSCTAIQVCLKLFKKVDHRVKDVLLKQQNYILYSQSYELDRATEQIHMNVLELHIDFTEAIGFL